MFNLVPFRRPAEVERSRDPFGIDSIFENFFNDSVFPAFYENSGQMRVDIKETDKEYIVEAEIPGAKKDEINLEIDSDRLTISVLKEEQENEEDKNYIRRERRYSSMSRSFRVDNIIPDKAKAKYDNGILAITLPKKEESKISGKKIKIE